MERALSRSYCVFRGIQGVAGADNPGKEGYLNESVTHSPEGWAVAKSGFVTGRN
jgi:hypothetical protein